MLKGAETENDISSGVKTFWG